MLTKIIEEIERTCRKRRVDLDDVLKAADVHPSTWRRWRAGSHSPQLGKLMAVQTAATTITPRAA